MHAYPTRDAQHAHVNPHGKSFKLLICRVALLCAAATNMQSRSLPRHVKPGTALPPFPRTAKRMPPYQNPYPEGCIYKQLIQTRASGLPHMLPPAYMCTTEPVLVDQVGWDLRHVMCCVPVLELHICPQAEGTLWQRHSLHNAQALLGVLHVSYPKPAFHASCWL